MDIRPLTNEAVGAIVEGGFASTSREAGGVTSYVIAFAEGHPQRAMQLADAVWRLTPEGGAATDAIWEDALATVRADVDNGSEWLFALLPAGHQKTMRTVASGGAVYGSAADILDLSPGTAKAAVDALVGNGYLVRRNGRLVVVDPLLADWIRRRFPV